MAWKSLLKPNESVLAGAATIGVVFSLYQLNVGTVSQAHATDSNHPALESSRKKAGYTSLAVVGALFLVTKDANIAILGGGTIIAMEVSYRHAIMAHPDTGKIQNPSPDAYMPAENVVPLYQQAEAG